MKNPSQQEDQYFERAESEKGFGYGSPQDWLKSGDELSPNNSVSKKLEDVIHDHDEFLDSNGEKPGEIESEQEKRLVQD